MFREGQQGTGPCKAHLQATKPPAHPAPSCPDVTWPCLGQQFPVEQAQSSGWRLPKPSATGRQLLWSRHREAVLPADVPKGSCSMQEGCAGTGAMLAASTASSHPWDMENAWVEAGCPCVSEQEGSGQAPQHTPGWDSTLRLQSQDSLPAPCNCYSL